MPTFYNFTENGVVYNFDNVFVPADFFRDGNLWTWGLGSNGELGNSATTSASTPITTFLGGANWKQVSIVFDHASAIKTDGTLWLWGAGTGLGNLSVTTVSTPITTFLGGTNWKQVSNGNAFTSAIKTDGTLWTWGFNGSGQLGNASTNNSNTPVTTFLGGTNWKQLSCGLNHVSAIKTDGTLWLWGVGTLGRLGNANATNRSTPVTTFLGGSNWAQVSTGNAFTAAIKTDGTLWTWGFSSTGQLGNSTTVDVSTPVTTFLGGTNWKQVWAGNGHIAAIKTDGTLWTWGRGSDGHLGNANTTLRSTPVTTFLGGNNWKQVSSGYRFTTAIKTNGTLWAWGRNNIGQIGNADTTLRSTPVTTFLGGTNWKQVSSGNNSSVAVTYIDYSQTT